jgi:predicted phosphodiesterase
VRIGLASDTFGNVAPLEKALDAFARAGVDRVFFLGGRLADLGAALARRRGGSRGAAVPRSDAEFLAAVEGALSRHVAAEDDPLEGRIVRVASRACAEYARPEARKQVDLVEGRICCLVHDKADLSRDDIANATLIFHGNSAQPALVQIGTRFFVTPGHLRAPEPAGRPATFATLEATARELVLTAFSPAGDRLSEQRASFGPAAGKLSVRG